MRSPRLGRLIASVILTFMLALPAALVLEASEQASGWSGVTVDLDHPAFAGKGQVVPVTLTMAGGPAGDTGGNFSYKAEITASNKTGSSVSPNQDSSASGVFKLNLTMPGYGPQTIKIKVNATSKATTLESRSVEVEFTMKVVDPIVISAEVFNLGPVDAGNVTAKFYADGTYLDSKKFNVSAFSSTVVSYNWTSPSIKEGKHVVSVVIDDPNQIVEFSDGNNVYSMTIYVGEEGNVLGAVLTIGVVIAAVLFALVYIQKPVRRGKKF